MTITMDQLITAVNQWEALYKPANFAMSDHNVRLVREALINRIKMGAPINAEKVRDIVHRFMTQHESDGVRGMLELVNGRTSSAAPPSSPADNLPDADEPLLKGLRCLEDIAEKGATISKKVLELGGHGVGGTHSALLDKLNRRLAYIQEHRIKRSDLPPTPSESKPQPVAIRKMEDSRITAIREQIEKESTGGQYGFSNYAQAKNKRLNRILNELLQTPSKQIFHDRSRGGVEVLKGIDAIEKLMEREIRDADNPIR